jgi:hypothetical protein
LTGTTARIFIIISGAKVRKLETGLSIFKIIDILSRIA